MVKLSDSFYLLSVFAVASGPLLIYPGSVPPEYAVVISWFARWLIALMTRRSPQPGDRWLRDGSLIRGQNSTGSSACQELFSLLAIFVKIFLDQALQFIHNGRHESQY